MFFEQFFCSAWKVVKNITCVQEVIRRLRNTQRDMDWSVKKDILAEFAWSLHLSGYSEQFRYDVHRQILGQIRPETKEVAGPDNLV